MNVSASRDKAGKIHVSLVNIDPHNAVEVTAQLPGADGQTDQRAGPHGRARSPRTTPSRSRPSSSRPPSTDAKVTEGGFTATLPAKSIVVLEIEG